MSDITVTKVTLNEIESLQEIGKRTFSETFAKTNNSENMSDYLEKSFSLEKLSAELNHIESQFFFAIDNKHVVGYMKLNTGRAQTELQENDAMEIERIYILEAYQGKKIGQLLFDLAIQIASEKNIDYVWLGVWEKNDKAVRFYEKNGFAAFDQHIFKLGEDEQTDILMKKSLKG